MNAPTVRRGQMREAVFAYVQRRALDDRPPTVREIQKALGFRAVQSVQRHLEALVAEGRLLHEEGKSRGYRVAGARTAMAVPIVGRVQAGPLTLALEEIEGHVFVESHHCSAPGAAELFALRVRGESMRDAGILDGDLAIVRRQPTASFGDIVVAMVGEEATLKRFEIWGDRVELWPENPDFTPIVVPAGEELVLLGKVVEIRRELERS